MLENETYTSTRPAIRWIGVLSVCLIIFVLSVVAYSVHERSVANRLSAENDRLSAVLKDTRSQIDALNAKLNAVAPAPQPVQEKPRASASHRSASKVSTAHRHAADDPRWKKVQAQLDSQGNAIESTRQDLVSTRTELQGSIARTHNEIVVLQKKGERNYYEFDLDKSKQFQHAGPVGISLRKANTKDQYADLKLMVEDAQLSKKHVNLFEPVRFYPGEDQQSVELVINNIRKNHIHGYISLPKYSSKDLAGLGADSSADMTAISTPNTAKSRQRLEIPR